MRLTVRIVAQKSIRTAARHIENATGLIPCGTGGQISNGVKMLALAFDCHEQLDIHSGRKLIITALEKFKSDIREKFFGKISVIEA